MNEQQENSLFQVIGRLEGKIDGINQRLDVSNGRVAKSEVKIEILEEQANEQRGAFKFFNVLWAVGIALVGIGLSVLAFFKR